MMWIARNKLSKLEKAVQTRPSVLLTGVRQVGKSTLLCKMFPKAEYITFDKVLLAEEATSNAEKFLARLTNQTILDEVQYVPMLFRELKVKIDENRDAKGQWLLTGSQQFQMMKEVSESLAGRIRIINLYPLGADELHNAGLLEQKRDLLWKGGFPEVWAKKLPVDEFFEDYINTYLERDLKRILDISNLADYRRLLMLLALRAGQLLNYSELSKGLGIAVNTVKSWIQVLEIAGLIFLLPPYHSNLGKRLIKSPKVYFCDNGLLCALLNIRSLKDVDGSPFLGSIWENLVFTEFLKEDYLPGKNMYYFRDQNGVEIDFILESGGQTFLVEAKSNERPDERKLNFRKVAPLFPFPVQNILACGIEEKGTFHLKNHKVYNPLFGQTFDKE
ncbi:MAG: ATP-binding protein [Cyclobacteriaceae bacterium]